MKLGVEDGTKMLEFKTFGFSLFADADPVNIALAHMKNAVGTIQKVMDLTFKDRLKIRLHFPPRHLNPESEGDFASFLNIINLRSDDFYFPVFHFI